MLDDAFEALKTYDWGADSAPLNPIDEAVIAVGDDPAASKELESRLAAVLGTDAPRDAKDYVCRKLMLIGTAASAPALRKLLAEADHAHMARFALERIPAGEAAQALRDALPGLSGALKVGVISSLGVRRDEASVPALSALLGDADAAIARAAAMALGNISSADAGKALAAAKPADAEANLAVIDGRLACAESLLAGGENAAALAIYKQVAGQEQPKHIRLAATRGMLAAAGTGQGSSRN